jgi:hypothetical protein
MRTIVFTNPHRRKHYEFFRRMDQPHFGITANVQIPTFLRYIRERQVPFTPAVVYCIARAANAAWGKYVEDGERVTMPLSVQAFHALVSMSTRPDRVWPRTHFRPAIDPLDVERCFSSIPLDHATAAASRPRPPAPVARHPCVTAVASPNTKT